MANQKITTYPTSTPDVPDNKTDFNNFSVYVTHDDGSSTYHYNPNEFVQNLTANLDIVLITTVSVILMLFLIAILKLS